MKLDIIILAAGKSARFNSSIPKILHKIGNLAVLQHVLETAYLLNPSNIILVLDESNSLQYIDKLKKEKIKIVFQQEKLGTAHAVSIALPYVQEKVTLVLYGDTPLIELNTLSKIINIIQQKQATVAVLGFDNKKANNQYGRLVLQDNLIKEIIEYSELDEVSRKITLCNSGVMALNTDFLVENIKKINSNNIKKEIYLTDLLKISHSLGLKVKCEQISYKEGIGINCREDLIKAEKFFQNKLRAKFLQQGVTFIDPSTVYLSYDTVIEKDVVIHPYNIIGIKTSIKSNAQVLPFCCVKESTIESNAIIGPYSSISNSIVKNNAQIGNFVELKRSVIENNVKAKHLSYIGDSNIGEGTNVGAGLITCNFDGKQKHQTSIGKNCFIGANNTLVAPLSIGNKAKTGAGSTLTENVESEALVIARARQLNIIAKKNSIKKEKVD